VGGSTATAEESTTTGPREELILGKKRFFTITKDDN